MPQGEGNINGLVCPVCEQHLIKTDEEDGINDCKYTCFNQDCRGLEMEYPVYYGYTQEDINNNVKKEN